MGSGQWLLPDPHRIQPGDDAGRGKGIAPISCCRGGFFTRKESRESASRALALHQTGGWIRGVRNPEPVTQFLHINSVRDYKLSPPKDILIFFYEGNDVYDNVYFLRQNFKPTRGEQPRRIELKKIQDFLNTEFEKTLISNLFTIVIKSEKQRPTPNWELINDFCDEFDPNKLSVECRTIKVERKGKMRDMELASDREFWFASKTKALFKLEDWTQCFELSKKALASFEVFHYSNDIWFARNIALAKKNLGNSSEAISELKIILNTKKEWFIQKELAELYFETNDIENAFEYAMQAITNFGPLEFKINLLFLLGKILSLKNDNELAFKHYSLSKLLRQNEGWKIPQELDEKLEAFDYPEIPADDISKLKSELKNYWSTLGTMEGVIFKILNDNERGKDGFLKCNNTEHYFSVSADFHLTPRVGMNTKVLFQLRSPIAGKKASAKIIKIID